MENIGISPATIKTLSDKYISPPTLHPFLELMKKGKMPARKSKDM